MNTTEVDFLADTATTAKNRRSNRSGCSLSQRVLGDNVHMPASVLSEDVLNPDMMATCPSAAFHRAAALRLAAQTAMLQAPDIAALGQAMRGHSRAPRQEVRDGDLFFLWRRVATTLNNSPAEYKTGWAGPAVVVTISVFKNYVLARMRGVLFM